MAYIVVFALNSEACFNNGQHKLLCLSHQLKQLSRQLKEWTVRFREKSVPARKKSRRLFGLKSRSLRGFGNFLPLSEKKVGAFLASKVKV